MKAEAKHGDYLWRETIWGELVTLEYGKGIRGYDSEKGQFRVYGTNGPIGWWAEALTNGPTVVVGRKGAYRGVHYSRASCFVIDTAFFVKPKVALDMRWVYYRLLQEDINSMDSGSAIPSTSRDEFYHLPVTLPPLKEQTRIADTLSILDRKIQLNQGEANTLEEMSQALFKSWFVNFDPIVAKSEGRKPFGMSDDIAALFPDSFEESELGAVPKGWRVERLDAVASIQYGKTLPTSQLQSCGFPVYGGGDIIGYWKDALCDQAVTLVTSRGSNSGMVWQTYEAAFVTNNSFVIRPKEFAARELVHESLKLGDIQQLVTGSAQPQLTIANFSHLPIVIPSDAVLNRFHEISGPMWERRCQIVSENRILTSTRDLLLPHLLSDDVGSHGQILTPKTQEPTAA